MICAICSPQECIRCLEHSPEGTSEASTHYRCTGAIYEAEHTLKYLAQKEEQVERVNEERRLRREEAEDRWKRLERDVEAAQEAKKDAKKAAEKRPPPQMISTVVKPNEVITAEASTKLMMDEAKTVEELLMEDDEDEE